MRNGSRVSARRAVRGWVFGAVVTAVALAFTLAGRPLVGLAAAYAGCLGAFAWTLPGTAGDGALVGAGIPLISMIAWHHPGHRLAAVVASAALAAVVIVRIRRWRPRQRGYAALGAFWMSVPVSVCAVAAALLSGGAVVGRLVDLVLVVAVLVLVVTAARRRSRDLSVGVVAGLLGSLALLVAVRADRVFTTDGFADGRLLGWPADLVGYAGIAIAGRIGPDRAFVRWRRLAAVGIAGTLLVLAGSATAYATALVSAVAHALFTAARETGTRGSLRLAWRVPDARRAILGGSLPLVGWAGLAAVAVFGGHLGTDWTGMRQRDGLPTLRIEHAGLPQLLLGSPLGLLAGLSLLAGAARVLWRVTGPGLPLWVPVVGLGGLASVLAGGPAGSPAWLLVACAELWVVCRCLRTDRDAVALYRPATRAVVPVEFLSPEQLTPERAHP